ncbi:MAG: hypothetical protein K2N58_12145 [Treponemataceae bacterium]|nr:hypothetical protein [Treponemataceae bacterium]
MFGANKKVRSAMPVIFFVLAICALANAFLFKHDYGVLSLSFMFDGGKVFAHNYFFFGFLPFVFMCVPIVFYVCMKKTNYQNVFLFAIVCAQILISVGNIEKIRKNYREVFTKYEVDSQIPDGIVDENGNIVPQFHLSRTRKNVVVLFLDRAISCFFPYVLQEFSELKTDFDGFVYYPNCVSFGGHTITGSSAMFGGYEYTGASMNERKSVLLKDKHNEALSLMPRIFSEAGFEVTVVDLPYTNYKMYFDKTVLSDIKNVNALELSKKVGDKYLAEHSSDFTINEDVVCSQRIKKFCFMEVIFPLLRKKFYDGGRYCSEIQLLMEKYSKSFFDSYSELFYLDELTEFDASNDTFTIIANDLTHYNNDFTLIGSDYRPGMSIKGNNESKTGFYDATTKGEITSYQVNACAYLLLSKWLKYLRKNNCYDNTRIIVVADHGFFENYVPFRHFKKSDDDFCAGAFNPLLLFKDFDMHGEPEVDNAFTSNAETPNLAIRNLPVSNVNPFTCETLCHAYDFSSFTIVDVTESGKKMNPSEWEDKTQFVDKEVYAYTVRDNIFDEKNWTKLDTSEAEK